MKNIFFLLFSILIFDTSNAQYTLRLVVNAVSKDADDWYVAGNFNNWNPKDEAYKLKQFGAKRKAVVLQNIPAGIYQFKFTRGGWDKVETNAEGAQIENREVAVNMDTIAYARVAGWSDDYPNKPKPNTASAQVNIIDTAFQIPQLNRTRRIWIYLPGDMQHLKKVILFYTCTMAKIYLMSKQLRMASGV